MLSNHTGCLPVPVKRRALWRRVHPKRYLLNRGDSRHSNGSAKLLCATADVAAQIAEPERVCRTLASVGQRGVPRKADPVWRSSLRRALSEFTEHYHSERNHQGRENLLLFPRGPSGHPSGGDIQCKQRLGGLLKYYTRAA